MIFISCNYVYLKSVQKRQRTICCAVIRKFPQLQLQALPPTLKQYALSHIPHLSPNSAYYNGILAIASTKVENGIGRGYERIAGDHAVSLRGRTYHYFGDPKSWKGGIQYFTHDSVKAALEHGESLISSARQKIIPEILEGNI